MPQWRNWQTRNVQVVVWVSMYRFESCLGHKVSSVNVDLPGFFFIGISRYALPESQSGEELFKNKLYESSMAIMALISIILIILDYGSVINIDRGYPALLNNVLLGIFTIDYFSRLYLAKDKKRFFKENIFDLLSIIPASASFNLFRVARLGRLVMVFRLVRLVGLTGKLNRLLKINGLVYIIYTSLAILIISAAMYSVSEHVSYGRSLWWAIATATTIGYGDISPHTVLGKFAAILLMII